MPPVGFEPKISAGERPKTYALDRAVTVTGNKGISHLKIIIHKVASTGMSYEDSQSVEGESISLRRADNIISMKVRTGLHDSDR